VTRTEVGETGAVYEAHREDGDQMADAEGERAIVAAYPGGDGDARRGEARRPDRDAGALDYPAACPTSATELPGAMMARMPRPKTPEEIEAQAAEWQEMADGLNELADRADRERKVEAAPDILRISHLDPLDPARLRCQANVYERFAHELRDTAPQLRDALERLREQRRR
jgi:hypothetical protein